MLFRSAIYKYIKKAGWRDRGEDGGMSSGSTDEGRQKRERDASKEEMLQFSPTAPSLSCVNSPNFHSNKIRATAPYIRLCIEHAHTSHESSHKDAHKHDTYRRREALTVRPEERLIVNFFPPRAAVE